MLNSIPGLYPLDANNVPPLPNCNSKSVSRDHQIYPGVHISPQQRTTLRSPDHTPTVGCSHWGENRGFLGEQEKSEEPSCQAPKYCRKEQTTGHFQLHDSLNSSFLKMFLLSFNVMVKCVCADEFLLNLAVRQQKLVLFEQPLLQSKLAHTNMTPREESQDLRKCSWDLKWDVRWPQCCV